MNNSRRLRRSPPGILGYQSSHLKYLKGEKIPNRIILPVLIVDKSNAVDWTVPFETRKLLDYDEMSKKYGVW